MPISLLLLAASALVGRSEAQSGNVSAMSIVEQYCFPKSGAPFATDSVWPSITMMYSGVTLTTASLTFTVSAAGPSLVPELSTGGPDAPANSAAASTLTNASPLSDATATATASTMGSPSLALTPESTGDSSLASATSGGTQTMSFVPGTDGAVVTPGLSSAANSVVSPGQLAVSPSASDMRDDGQTVNDAAPSTPSNGLLSGIRESGAPFATAATSDASGVASLASLSSGSRTLVQTGVGTALTSAAEAQKSALVGQPKPTGAAPGLDASQENSTISLSPSSVDALQLALVLKNLGTWVFNTSRIVVPRSLRMRDNTDGLANLVEEIAVQEQTQLRTLRSLLHRSGNPDVPPCQYDLPSNLAELSFLMLTLKSINLGVFMSMAESADGPVAILMSSIASVDAKHIALLADHTRSNASVQAFDTPATPAWAYNFALEYVRPGTCSVELPLPILPKLTIDQKTSGHVRSGANVSVQWDAAARSAVARSGNPVFVAWVNEVAEPVFTALTLFDETSGSTSVPLGLSGTAFAVLTAQPGLTNIADLTDATLAGPVVVSSEP